MPTSEDWNAVAVVLRAERDPLSSPEVARLYDLALADGPRLLGSFRRRLGDDRIVDLIHDLLAAKLDAIVAAAEPRAFFCIALQRRAISWLRRGDSAVAENPDPDARPAETTESEDARRGYVLDARAALERLPARERAMVVAAAWGEERDAIAREFGTSRANVDQIVSRVRRRFSEENQ